MDKSAPEIFGPITTSLATVTQARLESFLRGLNFAWLLLEKQGNFSAMPPLDTKTCGPSLNAFVEGVKQGLADAVAARQKAGKP